MSGQSYYPNSSYDLGIAVEKVLAMTIEAMPFNPIGDVISRY